MGSRLEIYFLGSAFWAISPFEVGVNVLGNGSRVEANIRARKWPFLLFEKNIG